MPGGNGIKMEKGFIPMINMERYSLILHCKNGITRINLEKLVYCEAAGRRLYFYLNNEKVLECIGSMDELYQKLHIQRQREVERSLYEPQYRNHPLADLRKWNEQNEDE